MEISSAADLVRATRAGLAASGFARKEEGGTVYWEGGVDGSSRTSGPVVMLHGVNDQAGTWVRIAAGLAKTRRVILPDLAGHGESEPNTGDLPISLLVDRVADVIGSERRITLVGNSLGGWLAVLYALRFPDRVSHLVLETAGGLKRPFASPVIARDREEALLILRAVHGPHFVAPEWVIEALLERSRDSQLLRISEADEHYLDDRLAALSVPTTLIWGADDGVLPVAYARELQSLIAGATLHVIPDAAHIPHLQQPERFLECLTAIF
jgi:pimeloyl-ACP methyl ester carboxylesterase